MVARIKSATLIGIDAVSVDVETQVIGALRRFTIVGLPDVAVRESRERVRCAIQNSGFSFPDREVIVSLAPASLPKSGAAYDLAIALSILIADGQLDGALAAQYLVLGELALDGTLKGVRGVLASAMLARAQRTPRLLIPAENLAQANWVEGLRICAAHQLRDAAASFGTQEIAESLLIESGGTQTKKYQPRRLLINDIVGQHAAKRALEITAAGGHNILLVGPPGAGKSMLARALPGLLPPLSSAESIEVTRIHSVLDSNEQQAESLYHNGLCQMRPFRAPHHSVSAVGLVGGGADPKPGEISLAHRGVLFLDEFVEFKRDALEGLRQPLEERSICVSRAKHTVRFPADFTLIAAMNPCPCGKRGTQGARCDCPPGSAKKYLRRLSGPILDRIDLHIWVPPVPISELQALQGPKSESVADGDALLGRIERAREIQAERFQTANRLNAQMTSRDLSNHCVLSNDGRLIIERAAKKLDLSARGVCRLLKVSRTIADLQQSPNICVEHLSEAIAYRVSNEMRA